MQCAGLPSQPVVFSTSAQPKDSKSAHPERLSRGGEMILPSSAEPHTTPIETSHSCSFVFYTTAFHFKQCLDYLQNKTLKVLVFTFAI